MEECNVAKDLGRGADARLQPGDAYVLVALQWRGGTHHVVGIRSAEAILEVSS